MPFSASSLPIVFICVRFLGNGTDTILFTDAGRLKLHLRNRTERVSSISSGCTLSNVIFHTSRLHTNATQFAHPSPNWPQKVLFWAGIITENISQNTASDKTCPALVMHKNIVASAVAELVHQKWVRSTWSTRTHSSHRLIHRHWRRVVFCATCHRYCNWVARYMELSLKERMTI